MTYTQFVVLKVLSTGGKIDSRVWTCTMTSSEEHWLTFKLGQRRRLKTGTVDGLTRRGWILRGRLGRRWGSVYRQNRKISVRGLRAYHLEKTRRSVSSKRA